MGYFNINSILYNFRKIFKYLSISLAFISFIILALLLMTRDVKATSTPTPTPTTVLPSFPTEAYNYNSRVVWLSSSGKYSLICCNSSPVYSSALQEMRFESSGCVYSYRPGIDSDWVFGYDFPSVTYIYNAPYIIYSNMNIYYTGTWDVFIPASSSEPTEPAGPADPVFLNYEDSNWSGTLVNGEFTYFYFEMPIIGEEASPIWFYFYDITDMPIPNSDFENGSTAVFVDLNWFYANQNGANYVYRFLNKDGIYHYAVPCSSLFGEYKNNRTYLLNLYWTYDGGTSVGSKTFQWTTNFTQTGITRQENNANDKTLSDRNNFIKQQTDLNNFLFSNSLNFSNYNLPNIEFDFNQEHFISDLFDNIKDAFIGNTYTDFEFTFPFSEETITIPSNYVEEHCPSIIVNLIRLFYWYIIGRYILKDVFRTIDKMRQGDWFLRSDGNIKTEVL